MALKPDLKQKAVWEEIRQRALSADEDQSQFADTLFAQAQLNRREIVRIIDAAQLGHIGGDLSVTDILTTLFFGVLNIDPADPHAQVRDRFILSKGHCVAALYVTLANCGYFSPDELNTFMAPLSALNGHPNRNKVPGVETNTGPLGHGLPVAVGQALALKLRKEDSRVFVVLGDGEMQEGSNWEAIMSAAHYGLDNLTIIVDRNRLQQGAGTEETNALDSLSDKFSAFGLEVREIDGHDYDQLREAFTQPSSGRPVGVIANTIKGKGVSFIENRVEWHHKVPNTEQVELALKELV